MHLIIRPKLADKTVGVYFRTIAYSQKPLYLFIW